MGNWESPPHQRGPQGRPLGHFTISRMKSPYDFRPNCRQNGDPKTTQCTTLIEDHADCGRGDRGRNAEAVSRRVQAGAWGGREKRSASFQEGLQVARCGGAGRLRGHAGSLLGCRRYLAEPFPTGRHKVGARPTRWERGCELGAILS